MSEYTDQAARTRTVFNALARLERAGSEQSRTTAKLIAAARTLGDHIAATVPQGVELPWGYEAVTYNDGGTPGYRLLYLGEEVSDGRDAALAFANDVATGWLDELAEFTEAHSAAASEAADVLVNTDF